MNEIKRNDNEPPEHIQLRYLLQEAKAIVLPMSPDQRKKWVAEAVSLRRSTPFSCSTPSITRSFEVL
jgi:hypothetical protein